MNLRGKKVVVTGSASGIGAEIVKVLLENNCLVVGADINVIQVESSHLNYTFYQCDVSKKSEVDVLFEFSMKTLGNIDIFIANAGIAYYEKILKPDWEHIQNIFDTNTISVIYSAERMKELSGDNAFRFVIISSVMGSVPFPGYALYCGTKAALHGFASSYRWELGKGQKLHVVYPISTRTNFFTSAGGSPVPSPSQSAKVVAQRVVTGICSEKESIYPSRLYYLGSLLNKLFPFINSIVVYIQFANFCKWFKRNPF
jgi:short-subunit dehydrogenase